MCFYIQAVFRYLCEEDVQVFTEKQFVPAVRKLATELILSGKTGSERNDLQHLRALPPVQLHPVISVTSAFVAGELHSHEALSSDIQKNVLSALRRLEAITKLRV